MHRVVVDDDLELRTAAPDVEYELETNIWMDEYLYGVSSPRKLRVSDGIVVRSSLREAASFFVAINDHHVILEEVKWNGNERFLASFGS